MPNSLAITSGVLCQIKQHDYTFWGVAPTTPDISNPNNIAIVCGALSALKTAYQLYYIARLSRLNLYWYGANTDYEGAHNTPCPSIFNITKGYTNRLACQYSKSCA